MVLVDWPGNCEALEEMEVCPASPDTLCLAAVVAALGLAGQEGAAAGGSDGVVPVVAQSLALE